MGVLKLFKGNDFEVVSGGEKKLPISFVKDFLLFFNISLTDIPKLIKFSEELESHKKFEKINKNRFNSLTIREKEVFILVVNGKKTAEIAEQLYVENTTISTHRKRIKQKLKLESIFDWYKYAKAFELINF
jgi:DNA-binding NarL/FixJ family response regulator